MPHSPQDKKRAITRLRRIVGQAQALERAIQDGVECSAALQQLAALRGAVNGLMAEVFESHLRESLTPPVKNDAIDEAVSLVRSYLK
jgi:FrmR/RcnR family transcriptional regulator, repressor of frmRAB operon